MSGDESDGRISSQAGPPSSPSEIPPVTPEQLVRVGLLTEGGCLLAAIGIGALGWYDRRQPLRSIFFVDWLECLIWTLVGLIATAAIACALLTAPLRPFREFRRFTLQQLVPLFQPLTVGQVALISAFAGLGEEMLFRWCLQGGLQSSLGEGAGFWIALVVASILFGLCHALNWLYVLFATIMGAAMGCIMHFSGSVVPPILAHGLYDFCAILVLREIGRRMAEREASIAPES